MYNIITEASMEDSFIYKSFNQSNSLIERMVKYIKTSVLLDKEYFLDQYLQLKKLTISPLSRNVMEAYDNGQIELLYSKEAIVGISIPYIVRKNEQGKIVATIFITSFSTMTKDNKLSIQVKQLYALLESAYIALQIQTTPMKVQRNVALMKICISVYTDMAMRIFNKEYALSVDKPLSNKVVYCIRRFFLERIWGYPNVGLIDAYSTSELDDITDFDLDEVKRGYDIEKIVTVEDLLNYVKTLSPRMSELTVRYYIERYINTFHGSSILSIDYLPYIFFVITNILLSTFLISQTALNDLVKNTKGINKFYIELSKIM